MGPLFLGIDVSTTGSKALLINNLGKVVASAVNEHTISTQGRFGRSKIRKNGGMLLLKVFARFCPRLVQRARMSKRLA